MVINNRVHCKELRERSNSLGKDKGKKNFININIFYKSSSDKNKENMDKNELKF